MSDSITGGGASITGTDAGGTPRILRVTFQQGGPSANTTVALEELRVRIQDWATTYGFSVVFDGPRDV